MKQKRVRWPANEFYDTKHDAWFRVSIPQRRVRSLVAPSENAIGRAIGHLAEFTFSRDAPERDAQFLFEMFPALVDALPHELFPQVRLPKGESDDLRWLPADLVRLRGGVSAGTALITELKLASMPITVDYKRPRISVDALKGITQVRDYKNLADRSPQEMSRIFGGVLEEIATRVIIGRAALADPDALTQLRSDYRDVIIDGFDETLEQAMRRWDISSLSELKELRN